MSESNSLVCWGIEGPDAYSNPPKTAHEKLFRAVRLGALVNACDWSWRQAWFTGLQEWIDAGNNAFESAMSMIVPRASGPIDLNLIYIRLFKTCFIKALSPRESWRRAHDDRSYKMWRGCHDAPPEQIPSLLAQWRDNYLKQEEFFEDVPDAFGTFLDERELAAFKLGVVLDRGIRPLGVHHHVYVPSDSPDAGVYDPLSTTAPPPPGVPRKHPPYLGNHGVTPGEIAPEDDWLTKVAVRWREVFGESADLDGCMKDARNDLVNPAGRRKLVDRLFRLAEGPSPSVSAATPKPLAASNAPVLAQRIDLGAVTLEFDVPNRRITIVGTDRVADFGDNEYAFQLAKHVCERTCQYHGPVGYADLHLALWKERDDSLEARVKLRSHARTANKAMEGIGFRLKGRRNSGYALTNSERSSTKPRRERKQK